MWPCCLSLTTITPALPKQITWRLWLFSNGSLNYSQEWDCPSMANMFIVEITSTPAILWHSSWLTWSSKNVSFVYFYLRGICCWQQQKDGMFDLSFGCQLIHSEKVATSNVKTMTLIMTYLVFKECFFYRMFLFRSTSDFVTNNLKKPDYICLVYKVLNKLFLNPKHKFWISEDLL